MKKRVNCANAGCNYCSKAICVGENFFGDKLYRCTALKRKHKKYVLKSVENFVAIITIA